MRQGSTEVLLKSRCAELVQAILLGLVLLMMLLGANAAGDRNNEKISKTLETLDLATLDERFPPTGTTRKRNRDHLIDYLKNL